MTDTTDTTLKPGESGWRSEKLYEALHATITGKGDFVTYAELKRLSGVDPQEWRGAQMTARRRLEREYGLITYAGQLDDGARGVYSPTDAQYLVVQARKLRNDGRRNRKEFDRYVHIDRDGLDRDQLIMADSQQTVRRVMAQVTARKAYKDIRGKIAAMETPCRLPVGDTVGLFADD